MNQTSPLRHSRHTQRGFTLLEMMFAVSLMSLLFLGAMGLIVSSSRTTVRTQSQMNATSNAANTIQNVIGQLREAQSFTLPVGATSGSAETSWVTPGGTTLSQFNATVSSQPISTAIEIIAPPTLTPTDNNYKPGVTTIQVQSLAGTGSWSITPYKSDGTPGSITLIYRGDPDGTPDPDPTGSAVTNAGTYLWQYAMPASGNFVVTKDAQGKFVNPVALCKSVATASNAIQFVRPVYASAAEKFQVEVKIISGYYSPINGQQTSEEGNGATTSQLTGKCVFMRDHSPNPSTTNANTRSSNNAFQYH